MPAPQWFNDSGEVHAFAEILREATNDLEDAQGVMDYFEKPWRWDDEHAQWVSLGSPNSDDKEKFDEFIEWCDTTDR